MALPLCILVPVGGRRSQRPGPSPTLWSLWPSHQRHHKSWVSLQGLPCAHGVSGTSHGEVRDNITRNPINISCAKLYLINHVEPNTLWSCIIVRDNVYFFHFIIISLDLIPLDPNLSPSSSCLTRMISKNLLSNPLPMLMLTNSCVRTLNSLIHQLYKVVCSNMSPLTC